MAAIQPPTCRTANASAASSTPPSMKKNPARIHSPADDGRRVRLGAGGTTGVSDISYCFTGFGVSPFYPTARNLCRSLRIVTGDGTGRCRVYKEDGWRIVRHGGVAGEAT